MKDPEIESALKPGRGDLRKFRKPQEHAPYTKFFGLIDSSDDREIIEKGNLLPSPGSSYESSGSSDSSD